MLQYENVARPNFEKEIMETTLKKDIQSIIDRSLKKAHSYDDYRLLLDQLVEKQGTTGPNQSENLVNYTMLNQRRFKRWEKTLKISGEHLQKVQEVKTGQEWIVITESWCGDAANLMPVMEKLANLNKNISIKVVLRDENPELMDEFITDGNRSIPKLISRDQQSKDLLFTYGPRPSIATKIVKDYKAEYGKLTPEFKEDLQRWYNKDKGQTAMNDLIELLSQS